MQIKKENPPNLQQIYDAGMNPDLARTIFTYGDTIYNPGDCAISADLEVHEEIHCKQQGDNPKDWWVYYIEDPEFRLKQELEAYAAQYMYICKTAGSRNIRRSFLFAIAKDLAGPTYGNIITPFEANKQIRKISRSWQ